MTKRKYVNPWATLFARSLATMTKRSVRIANHAVKSAVKNTIAERRPPAGKGDWIAGMAIGATGVRRYQLYRPVGVKAGERLPLIVMLHGCQQNAKSFASSTRMNRIAERERFIVLYPEQDRISNAQGCWNWFDAKAGRNHGEAALIMKAIDQVCLLYPIDTSRVAVAGLSAGASMAALLVTLRPERFKAIAMHSGVPPGTARSIVSAAGAMYGRRATAPLKATPLTMATRWPPLLVIHGVSDHVVASSNGRAAAQVWADAAGARVLKDRRLQRGKRYEYMVTDFKCGSRRVATLIAVARLGHAWSGGAPNVPFSDAKGPDASRMVWAFAAKQFHATQDATVTAKRGNLFKPTAAASPL